jgi:hypothetical protein
MQPYHRRTPESTINLNVTVLLGLLLAWALLGIGLDSAAAPSRNGNSPRRIATSPSAPGL